MLVRFCGIGVGCGLGAWVGSLLSLGLIHSGHRLLRGLVCQGLAACVWLVAELVVILPLAWCLQPHVLRRYRAQFGSIGLGVRVKREGCSLVRSSSGRLMVFGSVAAATAFDAAW